ncbi:MAG TPA: hypothetical protein VHC41_03620 [Mycobacteriales bacterium]|jgi:hypothetical protein|nr:hypothetical protein [Mycobacteriales bacterium]
MNVRAQRWAMLAGVAFAILLFVGVNLMFSGLPDFGSKDSASTIARKVHDSAADSGKRKQVVAGAYLLVLAGLALLWFAQGLRSRLATGTGRGGYAGGLITGFGTFAGVALAAGGALSANVAGGIEFGDDPVPAQTSADASRMMQEVGVSLVLLVFGLAVAAMIAVVTVAVLQGAALPRWLGYAGWLAVLGGIFGVVFLPLALVALWALIVGILGAVNSRVQTHAPTVAAAPA